LRILAIDPGINLGYAISEDPIERVLVKSGCVKNDSSIPMLQRQIHIINLIENLLKEEKPDKVILEAVNRVGNIRNKKNASTWTLYWVYGSILYLAGKADIEVIEVNPSTLKAAVTQGKRDPEAKGSIKKAEVKKCVKEIYGDLKIRSDEADAIGLTIAYWKIYNNEYTPGAKRKKK